jgi:sterol desaturase/sphingolipid hydroxylase (fatty acid hydroxylase superfamily)
MLKNMNINMLFEGLLSFWTVYFIGGCLLYDTNYQVTKSDVPIKSLLNNIGRNALLTFLLLPIVSYIPVLIYVPDTIYGYMTRVIISLLCGDLLFYTSHRLLHTRYFYKYHAQHHIYLVPQALAGVYAHWVEMIFSNYLSMVIPLSIISTPYPQMMILEFGAIAFSILQSHSGNNKNLIHHILHHKFANCNYSFLFLTDYIFGTLR